jgi:hypothetical protein
VPPSADDASGTQQTDPSPQPAGGGGNTKKDIERQRNERENGGVESWLTAAGLGGVSVATARDQARRAGSQQRGTFLRQYIQCGLVCRQLSLQLGHTRRLGVCHL